MMDAVTITKTDAEILAQHGAPAFVNSVDFSTTKYFTYPDMASGSTITLTTAQNLNTKQLTYDSTDGSYPLRNKNMFPR